MMIRHVYGARPLAGFVALVLLGAGSALASGDHGGDPGHERGAGNGTGFEFGRPVPSARADRTVHIEASDDMTFTQAAVEAEKGETVRFVVHNQGRLPHSFTLATASDHRAHEREMDGMAMDRVATHMQDDPNGIVLQPGETESLTWRFTRAGRVEFACHIPGHYDAGMRGYVLVM